MNDPTDTVHFGAIDGMLPDWRADDNDADPDDEQCETPADVVAILGFDPAKNV